MPASFSVQDRLGVRAALVEELVAIRDGMVGPDGFDPALSRPLSLDDDAVEMCAAVYALPDQFRERGRSGTRCCGRGRGTCFRTGCLGVRSCCSVRRCC